MEGCFTFQYGGVVVQMRGASFLSEGCAPLGGHRIWWGGGGLKKIVGWGGMGKRAPFPPRLSETLSCSVINITKMLTWQLLIFRYPINNISRRLIPNLKTDDRVTVEKSNMVSWHQGSNASSWHYTCTFKICNKWSFVSDTYIQEIDSFCDMTTCNVPYTLIFKKNYESIYLFSSRVPKVDTAHSKNTLNVWYVLLWIEG